MKKLALVALAIVSLVGLSACQTGSNSSDNGFHKGFSVGGFAGGTAG